jgi:LPS sulfotransferase NodH
MTTDIDRPIFIVGPHRSGTTLLYRILSRHPDVGYFTPLNKRLPSLPRLSHLLTGFIKPDYPVEAQSVRDRFKKGDFDVMVAGDAPGDVVVWYRRLVTRVLELRVATQFLSKYPRLSLRLAWIDAIFPDAIFIHMTRNWRGV